jgi:2-hydroxychromene-2-carboxylate isomerase
MAARVAHVALEQGWGEEFSRAVYDAEFADARNIGDAQVLGEIVASLGQDSTAALARAQSDEIKGKLRSATDEAQRAGIFGAPSFLAAGELYWGNDRLEQAIAAAQRVTG